MQFFFQRLIGGGFISGNHQTGKTAIEDPLPEAPPCCRRRQMRFDMMPPVAGRLGDASQVSGQQRFDFSRISRDNTGAEPPENIAISSGERSTMEGNTTEQSG
jgi:hypothetical protein